MPNLLERVTHESIAGVSQTGIFPAQYNRDLGGEALLCAVDFTNVDDPNSDRDLSWAVIGVWPINHRGYFRAPGMQDRNRHKNHHKDSFHQFPAVRFSFKMRST